MASNRVKVARGEVVEVPNTLRKSFSREANVYYAVVVRIDKKDEVWLLTKNNRKIIADRAVKNPEDHPTQSWLRELRDLAR